MELSFDRGTLLLHNVPADFSLVGIPGVLWDPRVNAYRVPAHFHSDLKEHFARNKADLKDNVFSQTTFIGDWKPVQLRPYQESALCAWEIAGRRGIVGLPTGSGKTLVAIAALSKKPVRSLILVPTRVLLQQWQRQIREFFSGPIGLYGDGVRQIAPITIATFESAYRHMSQLGNQFEQIVVDEVHHFGNGLRDEALEMSIAKNRLGLTATLPSDKLVLNLSGAEPRRIKGAGA